MRYHAHAANPGRACERSILHWSCGDPRQERALRLHRGKRCYIFTQRVEMYRKLWGGHGYETACNQLAFQLTNQEPLIIMIFSLMCMFCEQDSVT